MGLLCLPTWRADVFDQTAEVTKPNMWLDVGGILLRIPLIQVWINSHLHHLPRLLMCFGKSGGIPCIDPLGKGDFKKPNNHSIKQCVETYMHGSYGFRNPCFPKPWCLETTLFLSGGCEDSLSQGPCESDLRCLGFWDQKGGLRVMSGVITNRYK